MKNTYKGLKMKYANLLKLIIFKLLIFSFFCLMNTNLIAQEGEKILCGFEKEPMLKIGRINSKGSWRPSSGYPYDINFTEEDKSEGSQSLVRNYSQGWVVAGLKSGETREKNPGVFRREATLLRTSGWHQLLFGSDWSGYKKLWIDVKSTESVGIIELELEDSFAGNTLNRIFNIPAGKWVTLEFDLEGAALNGWLELDKISSMYIILSKIESRTKVFVDNIRLVKEGKAKFEVLKDVSDWPKKLDPVTKDKKPTKPTPVLPLAINPESNVIEKEEPLTVTGKSAAYGDSMRKANRALASFDNKIQSSLFAVPAGGFRNSVDGGKTWFGLLNEKPYSIIASGGNTGNRRGFYCYPTETLGLFLTHCAGGGSPTEIYFRRIVFDGNKWIAEERRLVDTDVRHCPERFDIIRLPNGRLWGAWDHYDKFGGVPLRAKFSDDDGVTWQHAGNHGTFTEQLRLGSKPFLASFGQDGVFCAYNARWTKKVYYSIFDQKIFDKMIDEYFKQDSEKKIDWDRFAKSNAWSEGKLLIDADNIVSILGLKESRVLIAVSKPSAVIMWDNHKITTILQDESGMLTMAGDRILLFSLTESRKGIEYREFVDNAWGKPVLAQEDEAEIKTLAVPRISPVNFVPLAWSFKGGKEATDQYRTVRIPLGKIK